MNGTASDGTHKLIWWEDPVAALNLDGRAEIFIRITGDLTLWHMYQTDAKNPLAWDVPRGPVCLCNFPPCKGQTKCGIAGSCDNKGVDCNHQNPADYWSDHSGFPTSNMNTHVDPKTGLVSLFYRGFDGRVSSAQGVRGRERLEGAWQGDWSGSSGGRGAGVQGGCGRAEARGEGGSNAANAAHTRTHAPHLTSPFCA